MERDHPVAFATLAKRSVGAGLLQVSGPVSGLTAVAPQDPAEAAFEIDRGAHQCGFGGVIINSHTNGEYLGDPKYWPIFEAAEALDQPIYLHPNTLSRDLIRPLVDGGAGRTDIRI